MRSRLANVVATARARSVAARSVASATRQFSLAAADLLRTLAVGGLCGSGSASERRKAFVAGKYSSVGRSRREVLAIFLWDFLHLCRGLLGRPRGCSDLPRARVPLPLRAVRSVVASCGTASVAYCGPIVAKIILKHA